MKNKTALTLSTMLLPCMLWAQTEGHTTDMYQEGSHLEAVVEQRGGGSHSLSIEQVGISSSIDVHQSLDEDISSPGQRASIRQLGNYNTAVLEQSFESKEASLEQIGNHNEAYLYQPTFLNGDLDVTQHGDRNYADITQNGYRSSSVVEQLGDDGIVEQTEGGINNTLSIRQLEGSEGAEAWQYVMTSGMPRSFHYNSASIEQGAGLQNYASQSLYGVENSMNASQVGDYNQSFQSINGYRLGNHVRQNGIANLAEVSLSGRYHYSSVSQAGNNNETYINQVGNPYDRFTSNSALVSQNGDNNLATFDQENGGHAWTTQTGNHNQMHITHRNSGHSGYVDGINLYADQEGDYNSLNITQIGMDRSMRVDQRGNHNEADIYNSGGNMNFTQRGNDHSTSINNTSGGLDFLQESTGNTAELENSAVNVSFIQTGNHNEATADLNSGIVTFAQTGHYNTAGIEQEGGTQNSNIRFGQSGDYNDAYLYQSGRDLNLEFYQSGNENNAEIFQSGYSNQLEIHQNTDRNYLRASQSGQHNSTVIIQ